MLVIVQNIIHSYIKLLSIYTMTLFIFFLLNSIYSMILLTRKLVSTNYLLKVCLIECLWKKLNQPNVILKMK